MNELEELSASEYYFMGIFRGCGVLNVGFNMLLLYIYCVCVN